MRRNTIRDLIKQGRPVICGWLSIPSAYLAEGAGHSGYDCITIDLQHGMLDFEAAVHMLQAISSTPAIPLVRSPSLSAERIMHLLDAGAYGVIGPMVSNEQDARSLVSVCRYPPNGSRSFGPARGKLYGGPDYFDHADDEIMVIPMIETAEAVEKIDAILAVPGVDMVYIGPNDLALAVGEKPGAERDNSRTADAIKNVLGQAKAADMPVGIFCDTPELARQRLEEGFALVTPGNDFAIATRAMANGVARSK